MEKITNNKIGDFFMKKNIFIILFLVIIVTLIPKENKEELRIRVIANSDTTYDQNIKMMVVSTLIKNISNFDQKNLVGEVKANLNHLDSEVATVLKTIKYSIDIKQVYFPTKEVNGKIIPGGKYLTLLVVIDKGEGKNWWSLLYPEYHGLSFEDFESNDVEFKFYFIEKLKKSLKMD